MHQAVRAVEPSIVHPPGHLTCGGAGLRLLHLTSKVREGRTLITVRLLEFLIPQEFLTTPFTMYIALPFHLLYLLLSPFLLGVVTTNFPQPSRQSNDFLYIARLSIHNERKLKPTLGTISRSINYAGRKKS